MEETTGSLSEAQSLIEEALERHMAGDLESAIELYTHSIDAFPTAEAYTYRGWARSHQGRVDEAIRDCHRAIATDPEFGNPYNDIGSYLVHQGKTDEAIPWFEQAKSAARYGPRHFPYLNLGRLYMSRGDQGAALQEFLQALELAPDDETTRDAVRAIKQRLN